MRIQHVDMTDVLLQVIFQYPVKMPPRETMKFALIQAKARFFRLNTELEQFIFMKCFRM